MILSLDGKPIDSSNALRNAVARLAPGTKVKLDLLRGDARQTLTVALDERPANAERATTKDAAPGKPAKPSGRYGLDVDPLTPDLAPRAAHQGADRRRGGGGRSGRSGGRGRLWSGATSSSRSTGSR